MQLNPEQQAAVEYNLGPSIILAGAGSGKTRVLIHKVLHLIQKENVPAREILMITFTNKAASEMKRRMGATQLGFVGTFHALCARILRIDGDQIGIDQNFVIYDESDQLMLIKQIIKKVHTDLTPKYFLNRISAAKGELIQPADYNKIFMDYSAEAVGQVYREYQPKLRKNKALDFDDLLLLTHELLTHRPLLLQKYQRKYTNILVDEFQDTNTAQYQIAKLLASPAVAPPDGRAGSANVGLKNITAVGDFSQSIYSWRGADIGNLNKFKRDFKNCKEFHLEQNYRSTQQILDFAFSIISQNTTHPILHLLTTNKKGDEVIIYEAADEQDEAFFIIDEMRRYIALHPEASLGVLYRTNAQSRIIEEALLHASMPYVLVGGTRFYDRKEVKDVLSYLRFLVNPQDEVAIERLQKIGKTRFNKLKLEYVKIKEKIDSIPSAELMEIVFNATGYLDMYDINDPDEYARLENIKELKSVALRFPKIFEFLEQVALVESEFSEHEKLNRKKTDDTSGISLMTLHQAKGLEFDYVWVIGLEEGLLPHSRSVDDLYQLEEERRLFYVGITRARRKLYITHARRRFIFGRRGETVKSRFLS